MSIALEQKSISSITTYSLSSAPKAGSSRAAQCGQSRQPKPWMFVWLANLEIPESYPVMYEATTKPTGSQHGDVVKVLHIEDDPGVARSMARVLRLKGYNVISASSGDEAVKMVEEGLIPDLILTDYHLPSKMTGYEVIIEIAMRLGFKPPTIMLASVPDPRAEKMHSPVDRIFTKPADIDVLLCEMDRLLDTRV
jgi:CheY-like chemotaxis protein